MLRTTAATLLETPLIWVLALVVLQRLAELVLSHVNTRNLLARGGREVGARHYPLFVLLHASWLIAIAATTPIGRQPDWVLLAIFVGLQVVRVWTISTLGPYWTTRIVTLDAAPIVRNGPFRFVRHPNYLVVAGEIAVLPLAFGNWEVAIVWSLLNGLLLRHRIAVEMAVLAPREHLTSWTPRPARSRPSPQRH